MVEAAVALRPGNIGCELAVKLTGKLVEARQTEQGHYYTTLLAAAPDQYTQPMPFEIRSSKPLGRRDEVVTIHAELKGFYQRSFDTRPGRDGASRRVRPVAMALDLVEF